jgi:hypothetical protein
MTRQLNTTLLTIVVVDVVMEAVDLIAEEDKMNGIKEQRIVAT